MKIIWPPVAVDQARDIAADISLDKPDAAEQWISDIFSSVERLTDPPLSGRVMPEIESSNIRAIVQGSYRVIYKIKDNQIHLLRAKSYRQQLHQDEIQS